MDSQPTTTQVNYASPGATWGWGRRIRRYLVRRVKQLILVLLLIIAAHGGWILVNEYRIHRRIAAYHASGEPFSLDDLQPPLRDDENPVPMWRAAAGAVVVTEPAWTQFSRLQEDFQSPFNEREIAIFKAIFDQNTAALAAIDSRSQASEANWAVRPATPVFMTPVPDIFWQPNLSQTLAAAALYQHSIGNDAESLKFVDLMLRQAHASGQNPFGVGFSLSRQMSNTALSVLQGIAPDLLVNRRGQSSPRFASDAQVHAMITLLLDEMPVRQAVKQAIRSTRLMCLQDASRLYLQGWNSKPNWMPEWLPDRVANYVVRPTAGRDAILQAGYFDDIMRVGTPAPDFPTYLKGAPTRPNLIHHVDDVNQLLTKEYFLMFMLIGDRRFAATALAIRLYRLDHADKMPDSLDQLVPTYLPSVPMDVMASGAPLQYRPKQDGGVIYSVGRNGLDEGGSELLPHGVSDWHPSADDAWHLRPAPRTAVAKTRAE